MADDVPDYQASIRQDLPRAFILDVQEHFHVAARQAKAVITSSHMAVEGGIPLGVRRGNRAAGLLRHQVIDEAFEQLVARHGGTPVGEVPVDSVDGPRRAPVFLTTARFGATMIGFASHQEVDDLPVRNASRKALCAQNAGLGPDLFRAPELYVDRERFALIMIQRDPFDIGKIASMTMAVANPTLTHFLMQVDLNDFLASYGAAPASSKASVVLKHVGSRFRAGESRDKTEAK